MASLTPNHSGTSEGEGNVNILRHVTFTGNSVQALPYAEIRRTLTEHLVVRVRGLFDPNEIHQVKKRLSERFDCRNDRRHDPRDTEAIRQNLQKLQIGGISGIGQYYPIPRFLRMLFNPIFADDIYGMRKHFIRLAEFRNALYGLPLNFAIHGTERGLWTASRIHQYPRGGGFMSPHRDARAQVVITDAGLSYVQPFLLLSKKGEDYADGGAFIEYQRNAVYYEDNCEPGDVIVYDGKSIHGVGYIDPLAPLDLTTFSGRLVAFVSLYRHLAPGGEEYERLTKKAKRLFGPGGGG